jgi:hypothetical protein
MKAPWTSDLGKNLLYIYLLSPHSEHPEKMSSNLNSLNAFTKETNSHKVKLPKVGSNAIVPLPVGSRPARMNQQPPMHQLVILSTGWATFFHSTSNGVYHSPFLFIANNCTFFWGVCSWLFFFMYLTSHIATLLTFLPS